jgi:hypothetical protein
VINGLPAHVLLVHAVVVLAPLSALFVVLAAWWPAARIRFGLFTAILSAVTLVLVPITTEAGEWLEHRLPRTPLLRAHTHLGDELLPWMIGLTAVALGLYVWQLVSSKRPMFKPDHPKLPHNSPAAHPMWGGRAVALALATVALVVAAGSVVTVYRIGESGARAAWTGNFSPTALPRPVHRNQG